MKKLLPGLSNLFKKKPQKEEPLLTLNKRGPFLNFEEEDMLTYTEYVEDENGETQFCIQYACACGLIVFKLKVDDYGFACEHCDSVCETEDIEEPCKWCVNLFTSEGKDNAGL